MSHPVPLWIVFDLDDTLFKTSEFFCAVLNRRYGITRKISDSFTVPAPPILEALIDTGEHMLAATLHPAFDELPEWMVYYRSRHDVRFAVASHRGYHEKAQDYSRMSYDQNNLTFDYEHYLDSEIHPCKMTYLLGTVPEGVRIVLIDDRPHGDSDQPVHSNVVLVDQPWNKHYAVSENQRVKIDDVLVYLDRLIEHHFKGTTT